MDRKKNEKKFDVVGVGNAIVDVLSPVEESFIQEHQLVKGNMTLIDADRAQELYEAMPPGKKNVNVSQLSGGEKALSSIALVFSFFSLNPAPFCILDEIDAPLDDFNTSRFINNSEEEVNV